MKNKSWLLGDCGLPTYVVIFLIISLFLVTLSEVINMYRMNATKLTLQNTTQSLQVKTMELEECSTQLHTILEMDENLRLGNKRLEAEVNMLMEICK